MVNDIKVRASKAGLLMTEPQSKEAKEKGELSETAKSYCVELMVNHLYGRQKDVETKYTNKGLQVEEESLTLYSLYKKEIFFKNDERLSNEYITGHPDIIAEDTIIDIKSSWNIFTFHEAKYKSGAKSLNSIYYWQLQAYMALTGSKNARLVYCLINTPEGLIEDEKRRLFYKMGIVDSDNSQYLEACQEIEKLMKYDDLPLDEKVLEIEVERNQEDIDRLYEKVLKSRIYILKSLIKERELISE